MASRLRTVTRDDLTIVRRRRGKGFSYVDFEGGVVADPETRERILTLGIPPAWEDVRIARHPRAHIQCCGTDGAGRVQYIYHADWEERRTQRKLEQLAQLGQALPRIRRRVGQDLGAEAGSLDLALAIGVGLIDRTAMRVGRERYLKSSGTRGAGTLFARDVTVDGAAISLHFSAKGGKEASYTFTDASLADAIARIKQLPGKRLLVYRNEAGKVVPIRSEMLNAYLARIARTHVTAKDFRTLHASALAAEALAELDPGTSQSARKRQIAQVVRTVSEHLRNTPAICRKSYVAPCLFTLFDKGNLRALWEAPAKTRRGLKLREVRLGAVLASLG